jgi:hypothetical protein
MPDGLHTFWSEHTRSDCWINNTVGAPSSSLVLQWDGQTCSDPFNSILSPTTKCVAGSSSATDEGFIHLHRIISSSGELFVCCATIWDTLVSLTAACGYVGFVCRPIHMVLRYCIPAQLHVHLDWPMIENDYATSLKFNLQLHSSKL